MTLIALPILRSAPIEIEQPRNPQTRKPERSDGGRIEVANGESRSD